MKTVVLILLLLPFAAYSQTSPGDSILTAERAIDRPITMHKRQLRVTGNHNLNVISKRLDASSDLVDLTGDKVWQHRALLDVRYGILEYVQIQASIAYRHSVVREATQFILPPEPDPIVSHDVIHRYAGFEDLYVGVDIRAPFASRRFDVAITLGAFVPVAGSDPETPDHSFEVIEQPGQPVHKLAYSYHHPFGTGIPVGVIGAMAKYRWSKWALSGRIAYQHGLKDGTSYEWRHQLNGDSFQYRKDPYTYRLSDVNTYHIEGEYQTGPRVAVFVIASGLTSFNGWTSRAEGLRVIDLYRTSVAVSAGAEIMFTPRLWLREALIVTVAGKNSDAPVGLQTTLMYNCFPVR